MAKREDDISGIDKLKKLVDRAKEVGSKVPDYILDLLSIAFPRADVIWSAIKKLKQDPDVEPMLKADLIECLEAMLKEDKEVTERHAVDMRSDSWLSKNIRPLSLSFLVLNYVAMKWVEGYNGHVDMHRDQFFYFTPESIAGIQAMTHMALEFYFGGRALLLISKEFATAPSTEGSGRKVPFWKRKKDR